MTKNLPVYHQSNLVHYLTCPKKFLLSLKYPIARSKAMEYGCLFEGLVFGFKDTDDEVVLKKGVRKDTLQTYEYIADFIKLILPNGKPFVKIPITLPKYSLAGELDYVGDIFVNGDIERAIVDLKFTANIQKIWGQKNKKGDFLQAAAYSYYYQKKYNEKLPFYYLVVENVKKLPPGATPLIKKIKIEINDEALEWFENLINTAHQDIFRDPNTFGCYDDDFWNIRCPFFLFCKEGRKSLEETLTINFMDLLD